MNFLTIFSSFYSYYLIKKIKNNCSINRFIGSTDYYLENCIFINFYSIESGSCIFFSSTEIIKFLVELSSFENCSSESPGGAIFFSCINSGSSVITKTCGYKCNLFPKNDVIRGHFANIRTSNSGINILELITNYKCSYLDQSNGWYSIFFQNGNQKIKYINISFNKHYHISGISPLSPNTIENSYSTFYKNFGLVCNYFYQIPINSIIKNLNFINNYSPGISRGIIDISVNTNFIIIDSIFSNNSDLLFFISSSSTLTIKNSLIFQLKNLSIGSITFLNITYYTNNINNLIYSNFYTRKCLIKLLTLNYYKFNYNVIFLLINFLNFFISEQF